MHAEIDEDETLAQGEWISDELQAKIQNEILIEKKLNEEYPVVYVAVDSIICILFNLGIMALQIYAANNNAALSGYLLGVWAGLLNISVASLALVSIKKRKPLLVSLVTTMKLFCTLISFTCFVLVNVMAFYHYNCQAVSYYSPCYNQNMKPIHYVMIVIGSICVVQECAFFIFFQFTLLRGSRVTDYVQLNLWK